MCPQSLKRDATCAGGGCGDCKRRRRGQALVALALREQKQSSGARSDELILQQCEPEPEESPPVVLEQKMEVQWPCVRSVAAGFSRGPTEGGTCC